MKPKVLIVDDEAFSLEFLQQLLGTQFAFEYAGNGHDALTAVAAGNPAVVLMDVEMPGGMNGYQACRALKDNKANQNIPVIFISSHSETEDRLRAYESGGDDYVSKPFNINELRHKITLALANQEKRDELAEKAKQARTVAMMSLREAADSGVVLGFLSDIIRQTDLDAIAATTLRTLQKFQIQGAVQLRDGQNHLSRNSAGACTPVEDDVLTKMASDARIVDLGTRSAFNYARATIIVYDMPLQDPELYGRLKDTVVKMAEALDVQLCSLESVTTAVERGDLLLKLVQRNVTLARAASARAQAQRDSSQHIMKGLAERIEHAADSPGVSEAQKILLWNLARDARAQAQVAHDNCVALEATLQALFTDVDESLLKETPKAPKIAAEASATRFNSVELF